MLPTREPAPERPIIKLLSTVGKSSPVQMKISPKAADTPSFPIIAKVIINQLNAVLKNETIFENQISTLICEKKDKCFRYCHMSLHLSSKIIGISVRKQASEPPMSTPIWNGFLPVLSKSKHMRLPISSEVTDTAQFENKLPPNFPTFIVRPQYMKAMTNLCGKYKYLNEYKVLCKACT